MFEALREWFPLSAIKGISFISAGQPIRLHNRSAVRDSCGEGSGAADFGQLIPVVALAKMGLEPFDLKVGVSVDETDQVAPVKRGTGPGWIARRQIGYSSDDPEGSRPRTKLLAEDLPRLNRKE